MDDLLKLFEEYLRTEKNRSPHTICAYIRDLRQFQEYLKSGRVADVSEIDHLLVRGFIGTLYKKDKKSSVGRKLASIRAFFDWLLKKGIIAANPAKMISSPKKEKNLPSFLTVDEAFALMEFRQKTTFAGLRDRAILETLYSSGLRVSELAGLDIDDVNIKEGIVRVWGKGGKERLVPLGEKAIESIKAYLSERDKFLKSGISRLPGNEKPLFVNLRGGRLSTRSVERFVKKYSLSIQAGKKITPHSIRHTFATHLLDNGADLRSIQEMLGHASLSTTQKYTHLNMERLMAVYDKAHPRAKDTD